MASLVIPFTTASADSTSQSRGGDVAVRDLLDMLDPPCGIAAEPASTTFRS